jgi:hypothetical protein
MRQLLCAIASQYLVVLVLHRERWRDVNQRLLSLWSVVFQPAAAASGFGTSRSKSASCTAVHALLGNDTMSSMLRPSCSVCHMCALLQAVRQGLRGDGGEGSCQAPGDLAR